MPIAYTLIGTPICIFNVYLSLCRRPEPAAPANASASLLSRILYYATHRRAVEWFCPLFASYLGIMGLGCADERRWPEVTWTEGLVTPLAVWAYSVCATSWEAQRQAKPKVKPEVV